MKTKLFYKIFAFTFGMMLLITVLAHVLIFMIAPSENVLITSTTVTNEDVLAFSEVDMPQLITQTILKSFALSFACCMVISLVFSFCSPKEYGARYCLSQRLSIKCQSWIVPPRSP